MARIYTWKALADGQLGVAAAALYTAPADTYAIIKTITLTNTAVAARTVNLYVNATGVNRRIIPQNMTVGIDYTFIFDDELILEPGDSIQGDASVAACVDYVINGIEET